MTFGLSKDTIWIEINFQSLAQGPILDFLAQILYLGL